jgi:hypothetical protein
MQRPLSTSVTAALITILGAAISSGAAPARQSILTYHADPGRSGNFYRPIPNLGSRQLTAIG